MVGSVDDVITVGTGKFQRNMVHRGQTAFRMLRPKNIFPRINWNPVKQDSCCLSDLGMSSQLRMYRTACLVTAPTRLSQDAHISFLELFNGQHASRIETVLLAHGNR